MIERFEPNLDNNLATLNSLEDIHDLELNLRQVHGRLGEEYIRLGHLLKSFTLGYSLRDETVKETLEKKVDIEAEISNLRISEQRIINLINIKKAGENEFPNESIETKAA